MRLADAKADAVGECEGGCGRRMRLAKADAVGECEGGCGRQMRMRMRWADTCCLSECGNPNTCVLEYLPATEYRILATRHQTNTSYSLPERTLHEVGKMPRAEDTIGPTILDTDEERTDKKQFVSITFPEVPCDFPVTALS